KIKEFEGGLLRLGNTLAQCVVKGLLAKIVLACSAALDLDEVGGRKDGAKQAEIEDVGAVVAGGHHAHGHTDPRLAGFVGRDEVSRAEQVVVGEIDCELLGICNRGRDLYGKVRLVLARKHAVGN